MKNIDKYNACVHPHPSSIFQAWEMENKDEERKKLQENTKQKQRIKTKTLIFQT